jgi:NAD(P)-dependent dehydrogenase (short-subunit alcohol dehydrogenase family)
LIKIEQELGYRVVVTGSAGGIGREVTKLLAQKGYRVIACDIDEKGLKEIAAQYPSVTPFKIDLTKKNECDKLVQKAGEDGASLEGLINVAGLAQPGPACGFGDDKIQLLFDVNTFAPMRLTRSMIPIMLRTARGGSIVNVTSVNGRNAWPWSGVYASTKAAMNLFTDCIRRESLANNLPLRFSIVAPGAVHTPIVDLYTDKLKSWAETNSDSPFAPACNREADFQLRMRKRNLDVSLIAVDAVTVARVIVEAFEDPTPYAYYHVSTWQFSIVHYAALYLPTYLGDYLMTLM